MPSQDALVLVIDYDAAKAASKFVGGDPVGVLTLMRKLVEPAVSGIKKLKPDFYQNAGEAHRAVWFKRNHQQSGIETAILRLISHLVQELDRFTSQNGLQEFSVVLHSGFGEGTIEFVADEVSGEAVTSACACIENARVNKMPVSLVATIFHRLPAKLPQACVTGWMITLDREALLAIVKGS